MASRDRAELDIDGTLFSFPDGWDVEVFDKWPQYDSVKSWGAKGCDVLVFAQSMLWIIEVKDYTYPNANQPEDLPRTVGLKALNTMGLLYALQRNLADSAASQFARSSAMSETINLVLHIEVKDGGRKGRQVKSLLAPLRQKLGKTQKALGLSKSFVTSNLDPHPNVPWTTRRDPATRLIHEDR
ncbi:MAG: hypothetical protein QM705_04390 [Ancrocorticia sp.]